MASGFLRRKTITVTAGHRALARTLSWPHLVAMGVGAIVGTGILTLIGVGAERAGPAVLLSFVVAGAICACAALCYAEMATAIPASGSAYTYSYVELGEIFAWIVGWSLVLEYSLVVATVAVGWSGYATGFLGGIGVPLPAWMSHGPAVSGSLGDGTLRLAQVGINVPAIAIILIVAGLLSLGTRESARVNSGLVIVKIVTLALFVAVALPRFDPAHLSPFAPFGYGSAEAGAAVKKGMMAAAAIIFFAFYGFDAISTAAEETKRPERDLAIGIVGSMAVCTAIYLVVAAAAVGAVPFGRFAGSPEPLALILRDLGQGEVATVIAAAAAIALPTVILGFLYGQSRIFLVMARDGFLPAGLTRVSARGTPVRITMLTALFVAVLAGVLPLDLIASLANAGTLCAFVAVAACVIVRRRRGADAAASASGFRMPAAWLLAPATIAGCAYLFTSLGRVTQWSFLVWNLLGVALYLAYGHRRATMARGLR